MNTPTPMPGTALPWRVDPVMAWISPLADHDAPVCALRVETDGENREGEALQDAAYIVWACNNAPALLSALEEGVALIDELNERATSRAFYGINQVLHAKLCTVRATLARTALAGGRNG